MAATAVYSVIGQASRGDNKVTLDTPTKHSNISATTAAFALSAGSYVWTLKGATFGTVTLQILAGDGSTWIDVKQFSANGVYISDLCAGSYRLAIA